MLTCVETSIYVGPARIARVSEDRVQLAFPDQEVWARMALAGPYQPAVNDTVLVIGQDDDWYVIGVLKGSGTTTFRAPADLRFLAPQGKIELISADGVGIQTREVKIVTGQLEIVARKLYEKLGSAWRWVKDLFQVRAGQAQTLVKQTFRIKAERIVERADGDVRIDGKSIHLG
jgi:hypothetical protein